MKVSRKLIGSHVEVLWKDPNSETVDVVDGRFPCGNAALARWKERGVLIDITDGVLTIQHSVCEATNAYPRYHCTWVPEELVLMIDVFVKDNQGVIE